MLVRREGTVVVLETGVYFPMRDIDCSRRGEHPVCFLTRAGFQRITGEDALSQRDLQILFRKNRATIERLANTLYEVKASG
jgi:hypothetical protein